MPNNKKAQILYKIVVIGESGTGKTSLLTRYVNNKFLLAQSTTVGIEFTSKIITIADQEIRVQLWDTAGQEKYRTMGPLFYKNAVGALIVFDLTDKNSLSKATKWIHEIRENSCDTIDLLLVGNKSDLKNRKVTKEDVTDFMTAYKDMQYIQTSAAEGTNVEIAFQTLVKVIYKNYAALECQQRYQKKPTKISLSMSEMESQEISKTKGKECCK